MSKVEEVGSISGHYTRLMFSSSALKQAELVGVIGFLQDTLRFHVQFRMEIFDRAFVLHNEVRGRPL